MSESGIAKIFKHGRSQAVRLPLAFRLPGDRVRVRRVEGVTVHAPVHPTSRGPGMRVAPRSIARPVAILSGLAVLVATANSPAQERGESRPAPRLERPKIPDPPRQKDPWQPPATTLPTSLVNASATLFEQGLADSRGCDYRAIEIGIGSVWSGDEDVAKTRGWVLPATDGASTRFAVAWNGLVYPTVSIGEPADLEADVRAIAHPARPGPARASRARGPTASGRTTRRPRSRPRACTRSRSAFCSGWAGPTSPRRSGPRGRDGRETSAVGWA